MIPAIYKNKGDKTSPDNYGGNTILSCFRKLFTAVLNKRLNNYLESMNMLCEAPAEYRKNMIPLIIFFLEMYNRRVSI